MNAFSGEMNIALGAGMSIAAGPIGRTAEAEVRGGDGGVAACYSYSHSRGLFAGVSLEVILAVDLLCFFHFLILPGSQGSVLSTRNDLNQNFYGKKTDSKDILAGTVSALATLAALSIF